MTGNLSRRGSTKGQGQLSVWPETETPDVERAEAEEPVTTADNDRATPERTRSRQLARANPRMLEWARTSAGMTPDRAAKRLRTKPESLAQWEAGSAQPTIPQLRKLARLYKRPLAAFYLPAPPRHFTVTKDFRRLPDQPPLLFSPELLFALRIAAYRRDVAAELEPGTPPSPVVRAGSLSDTPEALGGDAREMLGVSLELQRGWKDEYAALNGWKNAVEELGVLVFHFGDVEETEVRGFSISEKVLPVIGLNGGDSVNGRIFTLIHEFGHLMLGEGGSCDLAEFSSRVEPSLPVEIFCNAFAASVLVPRKAFLAEPNVARASPSTEWTDSELEWLARRYRVSREVVLRRLLTLGKADADFYKTWRADLLSLQARDDEERSSGRPGVAVMTVRDVGKPFARLVIDAYHSDAITGGDVSEFLGVRLKHLPAIEMRLSGPDLLTGGEQ